jgi:hypothetical protein
MVLGAVTMAISIAGLLMLLIWALVDGVPRPMMLLAVLFWNLLLGSPLASTAALDRVRRGKRLAVGPPLRPAWWYRTLAWIAGVQLAGNLAIVLAARMAPPLNGPEVLGTGMLVMGGLNLLLFTFTAVLTLVLNLRVARWEAEGAPLPAPPVVGGQHA